ncbi:ribonuclease E inhibitor RraB [Peribacillus deserti]|uniref:Ribonuclease E inhibitor RraB n=1 Tax=Peribacillus deserti TaxID=673318 RepID=A0A2N5MBP8_9BACI|nr:ribonuclease E inhibitor RraB [Peribacillus deserti]PLT31735.1 ribonuclease E inhibitor RraB [Peribacillus deserti]
MNLFRRKFPNYEAGQVLKMLYKQGVDFKKPQDVDFFIAVPDKKSGESIVKALEADGVSYKLEQDEETEEWTCLCYVNLLLNEDIVNIQKRLDSLSSPYNVYVDGWGVMIE